MKLVFISGPYRADTIAGIADNIAAARRVAALYWRGRIAWFFARI